MQVNSITWIHILRAFATFAVIILHCSLPYGKNYNTSAEWFSATIINSSVRFCVPIFLMLTGVLLLGKNYSLKEFLAKRFSKIILPFTFWSIIYFFMINEINSDIKQIAFSFFKTIKSGSCYHLWYIYMIIGVYLFLPIINKWIQNAGKNEILFYLLIWLGVLMIDLPGINRLFTRIDWRYFSGFLGYVILGFYLNKHTKLKTNNWIFFLLFLGGNILTFLLTYFFSLADGALNTTFYNYLTPNVILSSIGIFLFCKNLQIKQNWFTKLMEFVSKYSYGIYLSHVFSLLILPKIGLRAETNFAFLDIFVTALLSLALSLSITFILNKLPLGKYIAG